jgi:hypothetical protein
MNLIKIYENYNWLWRQRTIFDKINDVYGKCYSPTEHLAVDEIILLVKDSNLQKLYMKEAHMVWDENLKAKWF